MNRTDQKSTQIPDGHSSPKIDNRVIARLFPIFMRALKSRARVLPTATLQQYVESIINKREVLLESASRFGTPQYFFDEPSLALQIGKFQKAFSHYLNRYRIFYALKSNSFAGICERVVKAGMGLDVSSEFELTAALETGCRDIIFSGPGKTDEELVLAIRHRQRVTLLLDSMGELERLSEILKREEYHEESLKVGIRVRNTQQGIWNKFGIPLRDLALFLEKAATVKGVEPCGVQFHTSWNLNPSAQVTMLNEIGSHIRKHVPVSLWQSLRFLDVGGGFWPEQGEWLKPQNTLKGKALQLLDPAARFRLRHYYLSAMPLDHFAREIAGALSRQGPPLSDAEVWAEPGRWISTPAMHILLRVVDKKDSRTVITDGGTNLLGWERPLSEFVPVINLTKPSLREQSFRIYGSLCTPHDIWGGSIFGDTIDRGDILVVPDQGAYTYSLRQSFIKPRSRVIQYDGTSLEEVEKEEKFSTYKADLGYEE
jgi:diaminopimelate decarboxylase